MPIEVHRSEKLEYCLVVRQIVEPDFVTYIVCQLRAASNHLTSLQTVLCRGSQSDQQAFPDPDQGCVINMHGVETSYTGKLQLDPKSDEFCKDPGGICSATKVDTLRQF